MLSATIGLTNKTAMQTSNSASGMIPVISVDNWALTIAIHDSETAKRLAGMLIQAAANREQALRKQREMADAGAKR